MAAEPAETATARLGPTTLSVPTGYLLGLAHPNPSITTDVTLVASDNDSGVRFLQLAHDVQVSTVAMSGPSSTELVVSVDDHALMPVLEDFAAAGDISLASRTDVYDQTRYFVTAVHF